MSASKTKRSFCLLLAMIMLCSLMPASIAEDAVNLDAAESDQVWVDALPMEETFPTEEAFPDDDTVIWEEPFFEDFPGDFSEEFIDPDIPDFIEEDLPEVPDEDNSEQEFLPEPELPEEPFPAESSDDIPAEEPFFDDIPAEEPSDESLISEDEELLPSDENSEDLPEETDEETEEPSEDTDENFSLTLVTFSSDLALDLTVQDESGIIGCASPEDILAFYDALSAETMPDGPDGFIDEPFFSVSYLLPSGSYCYSASAEGFLSIENVPFEITGETAELAIAVGLEESPLPCGFKGMPEGYSLSPEEMEAKRALNEYAVADQLENLIPGIDYIDNEVFFVSDSEEYVHTVADAYNAELKSYENGVAVLTLTTASVPEAVRAAADLTLPLPAVEPNTIDTIQPIYGERREYGSSSLMSGEAVPVLESWESWYNETGAENADTYLRDPTAYDYQYMHDVVNTYEAWGVTTGAGVTVAVLDSGVHAHEDLPRLASFNVPSSNPHATHVAGIIAADSQNGIGGAGIAPDASILSYCVGDDSGAISTAAVIAGINAVIRDRSVWIVNCSFGGPVYSHSEYEAFKRAVAAGITVVCAMGNDGTNIMDYPAAFNIPGLIAVSSTTEAGARSVFSNYGAWADVSAPGSAIMSTVPGGYDIMSGTSMAAPVVSGVCALYMSAYGHVSPAQMEKTIKAATTKGVVDASKLFIKDKTAPVISCSALSGQNIPYGSTIQVREANNASNGAAIVYTTNGKNPAVKNGVVTVGSLYDPSKGIAVTSGNGFSIGKSFTVKAACVSGMGVLGKTASFKFKVIYSPSSRVAITNAPGEGQRLISGKSLELKARVFPEGADPTVHWKIDAEQSSGCPGTYFDPKHPGLLITGQDDEGYVTVIASSVDGTTETARISIRAGEAISTLSFMADGQNTPITRYILSAESAETVNLQVAAFAADGKKITEDEVQYLWSSNNEAVATVEQDGTITGLQPGTAVITCTALDGSSASSSCTVLVASMEIQGQQTVAAGSNASYKLSCTPALSSTDIIWSISGHPDAVVDQNGKVTLPDTVEPDTELTLTASVKNGNASASTVIRTEKAAASVTISVNDNNFGGGGVVLDSKTRALKQATLYSVETDYWAGEEKTWHDARIQLRASTSYVTWASNKPQIATVTSSGLVEAHSAGTAAITCTTYDGRKASVQIKVINPASGVTVVSGSKATGGDNYKLLGVGKSVTNKAVLGDAFGKPTITKVNWSYEVEVYNGSSRVSYVENYIKSQKLITLSSSGTVSAKSGLRTYANNYDIYVYVTATTTDNTVLSDSVEYFVTAVQKRLAWDIWYADVQMGSSINFNKRLPASGKNSASVTTGMNHDLFFGILALNTGDYHVWDFTVESSNPKVAGGLLVRDDYGNSYLEIITSSVNSGSAKITVKATDGSNASASVSVKVTKTAVSDPSVSPSLPTVGLGTFVVPVPANDTALSRFIAPYNGNFTFTTTGSKDTVGYLYNSGMTQLATDDNSGSGNNFSITYTLSANQEVYIGVKYHGSTASGSVTLNISGTANNTSTVSTGSNNVYISAGSTSTFRFTAPYAGSFTFTTTGSLDTVGYLYDSGMTQLAYDDDSGDGLNFSITYTLSANQIVYIGVKYYSSTASGSVTLSISGISNTPTVSTGSSSIYIPAGSTPTFRFTAPYAGSFTFTTIGSLDTVGYLYDSGMTQLAHDDDGGDGLNFSITYTLSANQVVYIGVKYWGSSTSGNVTLSISGEPTITNVSTGSSSVPVYAGTITKRRFTAPYAGSFTFTTTGSSDTVGYLYDASMTQLAYNDDSGSGSNFSITYSLSASQVVYIGVEYYNSTASGSVTLNISGTASPTPTPGPTGSSVYRALIIGNTYSGTSNALPGCGTDARTMNALLGSMSATPYAVTMRLDRSASQILSDISTAFAGASSNDVSFFYYSGHGYSNTGYLVGNDGSSLSFSSLRNALDQIPGKKIVILDSCYSGQAIGKDQQITSVPVSDKDLEEYADAAIAAFYEGTPKSAELAANNYYVITACSKNQTSTELGSSNGTHFGAFTYCFEYVCGWDETENSRLSSMSADMNSDRKISLHEGYSAASSELAELAAYAGFTQTSRVNPENSSFVLFGR